VSGAQPVHVFATALERTWAELEPEAAGSEEGAVCGPDGCA